MHIMQVLVLLGSLQMARPLCPGQHSPQTSHELWPSPSYFRFSTWVLFLPYGLSFQSRADETHQGNSRAGHISKSSSWGQQPLYLLQNRNMVLVPSKSCFLHPYGRQHEQSTALPKASHPAVCMEELNSSPACIAPWQLVLASAPPGSCHFLESGDIMAGHDRKGLTIVARYTYNIS